MKKLKFTIGTFVCTIMALILSGGTPADAQEDEDLLLLTSQFGELCTMCEAYLRCEPRGSEAMEGSQDATFLLYYFKTKDFWGQIATIWDWFVHLIDPVQSQNRPVIVYDKGEAGRHTKHVTTAFLSFEDAKIEVPPAWIDRRDAAWYTKEGVLLGQCTRLPIVEAMDLVRDLGPWEEISLGAETS